MTRLVVFDLDGTLVDSARQILSAMRAGFAEVGRPAPEEAAILAIIGLSLPVAVERLTPESAATERARIVDAYRAAFLSDPAAPPLYPDVADTLEGLAARSGLLLAVATGKTRRGLIKVLTQHGLGSRFHSLHAGDGYPSKPDPAMLRGAMDAAGVPAERTVMVGDSLFDIRMAAAAGVRSIGVAWGYCPPAELRAAGASAILDRFSDLPGELDGPRGAAA